MGASVGTSMGSTKTVGTNTVGTNTVGTNTVGTSEVKVIVGRAVPVVGNDVDTDRIIPARFLKAITFDGLGAQAFADDRIALKGSHPFDQPQYQGATVLVVYQEFLRQASLRNCRANSTVSVTLEKGFTEGASAKSSSSSVS